MLWVLLRPLQNITLTTTLTCVAAALPILLTIFLLNLALPSFINMAESTRQKGRKYALLFGCPLGLLNGVQTDINHMKAALEAHGFETTSVCPAKKDDIMDTWHRYIKILTADDAIVIYYSGHGGMVENMGESDAVPTSRRLQYLMPMDFDSTTETEWKGISDIELSAMLRETTDKTKNTTMVLDCCHAARMARLPGVVKTRNPNEYSTVYEHIQQMLAQGRFDGQTFHHERNPDAVVLAASATTDIAWEQLFGLVSRSVLTEALEAALRYEPEAVAQTSWRTIMLRIRDRLKVTCPHQYPLLEGNDLRLPFSLDTANPLTTFPISLDNGDLRLGGGQIHGVAQGDRYILQPSDTEILNLESNMGEVVVTTLGPTMSRVSFEGDRPSHQQIGSGVKAFLKQKKLAQLPIILDIQSPFPTLRSFISKSNFINIVEGGEALAAVREKQGQLELVLREPGRETVLRRWTIRESNIDANDETECVTKLEDVARSRHLLALKPWDGPEDISKPIQVTLGTVRNGKREDLSGETITIKENESIYIRVKNTGQSLVYVSLFDVCAGSARLISTSTPDGRELGAGGIYTYGELDYLGELAGSATQWPKCVPRQECSVLETIVLVVTNDRIDLRNLETTTSGTSRMHGLVFNELIELFSTRNARDLPKEARYVTQFGVKRFAFDLIAKQA
ncbi:caspase domain-containing protein [Hypoxylon sp. FL1284]|nr:caspase domain-containing protein [Hypoxylon sp. FL1284]